MLTRSTRRNQLEFPVAKQHRIEIPEALYVFEAQGNRAAMEDTHSALITDDGAALIFGVFDGHGGDSCSLFCKERVCTGVANHSLLHRSPKRAFEDIFTALDEEYCKATGLLGAGSTATVAVFRQSSPATKTQPPKFKLSVAWAGDSSALIIRSSGDYEFLTHSHNGLRVDERRRIEKLGGTVEMDEVDKIYRVDGVLAVTRSVGDASLKPHVCATPEVIEVLVNSGDRVILASDGLWDFASLESIVDRVGKRGLETGLQEMVLETAKSGDDNVCALGLDIALAMASVQFSSSV